ncbi:TPA_asm: hypothetical protein GB034_15620 [Salmonella enterica subsp. diarizonae]|uniref:Uncharacterized protein n=1 Tax=Salmonella diarizonae TaxID=59204 RepID=A0A6X8JPZ3_SALDZ|nr:hypothetical protein [Salmonella enterica subsp. diarizonae]HAB4587864.1 hypothetical protein [Salmonella enterica subsp. diarizonae]HAE1596558.1 hypothetical protein [Salmonella enterica subsp. diarizonae]
MPPPSMLLTQHNFRSLLALPPPAIFYTLVALPPSANFCTLVALPPSANFCTLVALPPSAIFCTLVPVTPSTSPDSYRGTVTQGGPQPCHNAAQTFC